MKRAICVASVELDLGAPHRGCAAGPRALRDAGLFDALAALGHPVVAHHEIRQDAAAGPGSDPRARHLDAIAAVCARLADVVEAAARSGRFPLILGGDHALAVGSVAGLVRHARSHGQELGLIWLDAHPDMNTPETSPSGNVHGMPLAALLGHGPPALTQLAGRGPALAPAVAPERVAILGVREIDRDEARLVAETGVRVFDRAELARRGVEVCVAEALDRLRGATAGIHLSLDLDACDPAVAPGVTTPVPGGLERREALAICAQLGRSGRLAGVDLVELDPARDAGHRTCELAVRLVAAALAADPSPRFAGPGSPGSLDHRSHHHELPGS